MRNPLFNLGNLNVPRRVRGTAMAAAASLFSVLPAHADIDPVSGIDFVRIGAVGNAPYVDPTPNSFINGRGGVNYEYHIGRFEVTTSQWVEFFNAAYDRPANDRIPHLVVPDHWGAAPTTPNTLGGRRWSVPTGNEMIPVGDISWRMAAIYCNWLHNGKSAARESFLAGAYDVSTFGFESGVPNLRFTDQREHSPGARYWIPTWDEWLKAAHYDPNKLNADGSTGGWWAYANGRDRPPVYGPPGALVNGQLAEANAGWDQDDFPGQSPFAVPLGSYANVAQSPWGLLDTAGGTAEWTESIFQFPGDSRYRIFDGSFWIEDSGQSVFGDWISSPRSEFPHVPTLEFGLRLASSVPSPGNAVVGTGVLLLWTPRSRRRGTWLGASYTFSRSC